MAAPSAPAIPKELPEDDPDDVLFGSKYGVRTIELNRPKKLNSLNGSMARKIIPRLLEWEKSQLANVIMISGAGTRAFCAGGDVAALAEQNRTPEGQKASTDYFALEYQLDHLIACYSKPYIAIMDGITMGGGVGLSVHAPFRIATERTVFAMPETTIGFFPDVGGSFFLPRLDGSIGAYLALTSERLHGAQVFHAGIATHYLDSSVLTSLTTRLSELRFKDYAPLQERLDLINSTIAEFSSGIPSPQSYGEDAQYGNLTGVLRQALDRCFKFPTVDEILKALQMEAEAPRGGPIRQYICQWAARTRTTLETRSPTSLKVTLKQLREGRAWDINETFIKEHYIASKFMSHHDFVEGVSARLIKPLRTPQWEPATLSEVSDRGVDAFFIRPKNSSPLQLLKRQDTPPYKDYPHARFALPRESDIRKAVGGYGNGGKRGVLEAVSQAWDRKEGVREKVEDVLKRKTRLLHVENEELERGDEDEANPRDKEGKQFEVDNSLKRGTRLRDEVDDGRQPIIWIEDA